MSPTPPAQELHDWSIRVTSKGLNGWSFAPRSTFLYAYQLALRMRIPGGRECEIRIQAIDTDPTC